MVEYHRGQRRSSMSATPMPPTTSTNMASQPTNPSQARANDAPPRFTQPTQMANVVEPPELSSQQSPHTDLRHLAHGPAASRARQIAQRVAGGSSNGMSEPTPIS